ncbi:scavenger receptor cysteine-rich domain superfamily protein isoform X2 [Patella vulgata]|nr:scavenger receptor cysteine-rich domain superfamily protein isoform X2 [Patella vulgata]XP_055955879.1 scavenger receptor cysteine-rich domain superfamily protein isoform X2 [Patella vulgata]
MLLLLSVFISLTCQYADAAGADSLRLTGGGSRYGFVEMNIGGVWRPVCPGDNYNQYNDGEIPSIICKQLGYVSGIYYDMGMKSTANSWWYNQFEKESYMEPSVPNLDAYVKERWLSVTATGEFSYCPSSSIAVHCRGKVYLESASANSVTKERGFGYVVVQMPSGPMYLADSGLGDLDVGVICKELGYDVSYKINPDSTTGYSRNSDYGMLVKDYNCVGTEASLLDCPAVDMQQGGTHKTAVVSCSITNTIADYTVRLATNNVVEIHHQSTWGIICDETFSKTDAKVICASLGSDGSEILTVNLQELYTVWITNLNCGDSNRSPAACPVTLWTVNDNICSSIAAVRCYDQNKDGVYGFVNGGGNILGNHFVERSSENQKGLLVVDDINQNAVCVNLGYKGGSMYDLPSPGLLPTNQAYWTATAKDDSSFSSIESSVNNDWQRVTGKVLDNLKMTVCYNTAYLQGNGYAGLVKYIVNGNQVLINNASLNQVEINLICSHLGFSIGGSTVPATMFKSDYDNGDIYDLNCDQTPTNLSTCITTRVTDTTNINVAAISCRLDNALPVGDMGVFLNKKGIVHVNKDELPGRICNSDSWNDKAASVVCKQLGFDTAILSTERTEYNNGNPPVWFKSVTCQGTESSIKDCTLVPSSETDQNCEKVAAVMCYNMADKATFSLVDGNSRFGRVKITRDGKEGFLCLAKMDEEEAATICKELGFQDGDEWSMAPVVAAGTSWWSVSTNCGGDSEVIESCEGQNWEYVTPSNPSISDCSWKTAAVYCYSRVRLETAPYLSYGVVRNSLTKARFSSNSFGEKEATIGCKEMGFPKGGKVFPSGTFKKSKTPIAIRCAGTEQSLLDCPVINEVTDKNLFASVSCITDEVVPAEGSMKINDDYRLLIVRNGVWGGLCAESWTANDAAVVCQQLTGSGGKATKRGKSDVKYTTFKEPWTCSGNESRLTDCDVDSSAIDQACDDYAAVYCDNQQVTAVDKMVYSLPPGVVINQPTSSSPAPGSNDGNGANPTRTGSNDGNGANPTRTATGFWFMTMMMVTIMTYLQKYILL